MITFLLLVLSIPIPLLSEDITLRKGNEIICLSNIDSPIYLDPPFVGKHNSSANFLHLAGWDKDNWIIKNENEIIGPVIDKRWEGKVFLIPICKLSLSRERLVDMNIIKFYVEKVKSDQINL
jgi:hypothetical protein